jgi:hypothetical protein
VALTATRNLWLGSWFLANGLAFVRGTRLAGPHFRVNLFFDDPHDLAPRLTRQYLENANLQRLITSRRVMGDILDVVERRGQCEAERYRGQARGGRPAMEYRPNIPKFGEVPR